jgi:hypothetical protein
VCTGLTSSLREAVPVDDEMLRLSGFSLKADLFTTITMLGTSVEQRLMSGVVSLLSNSENGDKREWARPELPLPIRHPGSSPRSMTDSRFSNDVTWNKPGSASRFAR